jgi:hypothetical protein
VTAALLAALALGLAAGSPEEQAPPPAPREVPLPPPPARDGGVLPRRAEPDRAPAGTAPPDPDEEVIRNLDVLLELELLQHLDAFDPKAEDQAEPAKR